MEEIELTPTGGYQLEIEHFLALVRGESSMPAPTLAEAANVARWIQAEARSLSNGLVTGRDSS